MKRSRENYVEKGAFEQKLKQDKGGVLETHRSYWPFALETEKDYRT